MTRLPRSRRALLITAATITATALALTGCSSSKKTPAHGSTSPAAKSSPSDVSTTLNQVANLLVSPNDITFDKFTLSNLSPLSQSGAVGVSGVYGSTSKKRVLNIILIHYKSVAVAKAALPGEQATEEGVLVGKPTSNTTLPVGQLGHLIQGRDPQGPISIATFLEGEWVVTIDYVSKTPGDVLSASTLTDLATKEDNLVINAH